MWRSIRLGAAPHTLKRSRVQPNVSYSACSIQAFAGETAPSASETLSLYSATPSAIPSALSSAFSATPLSIVTWGQRLSAWLLDDLWPSILRMAVPKKRSSYRVKRTRQTGKSLKNIQDLMPCPICKQPKRIHSLCNPCTSKALAFMRSKRAAHPSADPNAGKTTSATTTTHAEL